MCLPVNNLLIRDAMATSLKPHIARHFKKAIRQVKKAMRYDIDLY